MLACLRRGCRYTPRPTDGIQGDVRDNWNSKMVGTTLLGVTFYRKLTYTFMEPEGDKVKPRTFSVCHGASDPKANETAELLRQAGVVEVRDLVGLIWQGSVDSDSDDSDSGGGDSDALLYGDILSIFTLPDHINEDCKVWLQVGRLVDKDDFGTPKLGAPRRVRTCTKASFQIDELDDQELVDIHTGWTDFLPVTAVVDKFTLACVRDNTPVPRQCSVGSNVFFNKAGRKISFDRFQRASGK